MIARSIAAARATLRRLAVVPLALRGVLAVTTFAAIVATTVPTWDAPDGYVWLAVIAAIGTVLAPDSGSALVLAGAVLMTWLTGSPDGVGPAVISTALALLASHVVAAVAGSLPVTARADAAFALHWARPTAAIAAGTVAAAAVVALLDGRALPASAVVSVLAIGAATATAWRWSAPD